MSPEDLPALPFDQDTLDRLRVLRNALRYRGDLAERTEPVDRDYSISISNHIAETNRWWAGRPDAQQEGNAS